MLKHSNYQQVNTRLLALKKSHLTQNIRLENTQITNNPLAATMQHVTITYSDCLWCSLIKPVLTLSLNTWAESIILRFVRGSQIKTAVNKQKHSLQLLLSISTVALQEMWFAQREEGRSNGGLWRERERERDWSDGYSSKWNRALRYLWQRGNNRNMNFSQTGSRMFNSSTFREIKRLSDTETTGRNCCIWQANG